MFNPFAESDEGDSTDAELAERATSGDSTALESLVLRHQAWIYNIAVRMVFQPHDAEEVTQEVLVKVVTRLSTFRRECQFRTWLYRIVANHVLNTCPIQTVSPWMRCSWSKRPKSAAQRGCCSAWTAGSG